MKVLCDDDCHKIEISEDCDLSPAQIKKIPRLGNQVFRFDLTLIQNQDKELCNSNESDDPESTSLYTNSMNLIEELKPVQRNLFFIIILLVLILVFN